MTNALATTPRYLRAAKSLAGSKKPRVDRTGGYRNAGLITSVSVITRGEALGHGMWIDDAFLAQVETALNAAPKGIKSRWTHPGMSSDGMGKLTSRIRNAAADLARGQVFADQHFLEIGHKSPDGDLATYQMDLAEEDPESYGLSIVFELDLGEMERFSAQHTDADGKFTSPDKLNSNSYPHARLAELRGADAVDDPAANPNGLFAREKDVARQADQLAAFALGLTSKRPAVAQLGLDPDRVRGFAARFLSTHKLEVRPMPKLNADGTPVVDETTTTEPAKTTEATPSIEPVVAGRADAAKFLSAFGEQGAVWFAQGKTWEESLALQAKGVGDRQLASEKTLGDRLTALETQLKAGGKVTGEPNAAGFQAGDQKKKGAGFAARFANVGARTAATA